MMYYRREYPDLWFDTAKEADEKHPRDEWEARGTPHIWILEDQLQFQDNHWKLWLDRGWGFMLLTNHKTEMDMVGNYWGNQTQHIVQSYPVVGLDGGYYGLPDEKSVLFIAGGVVK